MRFALVILFTLPCWLATASAHADRPNILLIVADDLGYADLGSFGSDIATPNLDALADRGIRFTAFHTAVMCAPTRAMLLSGNNSHVAGMARQSLSSLAGQPFPGYEAHLSDRIVPLPRLLRDAGYHTYMTGKWHLGDEPGHGPGAAGFERYWVNLDAAGNHWNAVGFRAGGTKYSSDGEVAQWPEGRYSTDLFTDRLIELVESGRGDGKPFFAFASYTSPHWPLQVPEGELDRYAGRYDRGYDALRERNFERLKGAGIVPEASKLPPRNDSITLWAELDEVQRRSESRKMELYAAMVSNLDHHVGRLLDYLEDAGLLENTLVIFMSDNGAAAEDFYNDTARGEVYKYMRANYDNAYDNMGRPGSFVSYGPQWAEAGSAPFLRYKGYTTEGGITAPMIAAGPGVGGAGSINRAYLTVMDLAPTFLALAGAEYPVAEGIAPMRGESLVDFLAGRSLAAHDPDYVTVHAHGGRVALRQGRWKLTNLEPPFAESALALYDIEADPGETNDLSAAEPEKYQQLLTLWRTERRARGILLPEDL